MVDNKQTKSIKLNKEQTMSLYRAKENELQEIGRRLKEVDNVFLEITKAENTLKEMVKIEDSQKLLINIGAGILVEALVSKTKEVKISLPGQIIVSKDLDKVVEEIEGRKKELLDLKKKFSENYNNGARILQDLSRAIQKMHAQDLKDADKNNVS